MFTISTIGDIFKASINYEFVELIPCTSLITAPR